MGLLVYVGPMVYLGLATHHGITCPTNLGLWTSDLGRWTIFKAGFTGGGSLTPMKGTMGP